MARKTTSKKKRTGRTCGVMQHHDYLAQTDLTYQNNRRRIERFSQTARIAPRTNVVRIPVVVHVLFHEPEENISQAQIDSQIEALNRDFRARNADQTDIPSAFAPLAVDTLIEFALARRDPSGNASSGITRTWTSLPSFPYDSSEDHPTRVLDGLIKNDEFGKSAWPSDSYLNMWVCVIDGGLLGYAQFPGGPASLDGVVVNTSAFGSTGTAQAPFNLGRTAVHEVGHYLNLLHIWGDDNGGCLGSDAVADTPNQSGPNQGDSVTSDSFPLISCNNGPHGDMFMNYMDYVNDETMVMFTTGQLARMNATLSGPRKSLLNSDALEPTETETVVLDVPPAAEALTVSEVGDDLQRVFDGVKWT